MIRVTIKKWRCVFADISYKKWDIVEYCEYIKIPQKEIKILKKTVLNNYWFWPEWENWDAMIMLWNWSLYNHSIEPNIIPTIDEVWNFWFVALRDIEIWDELVFNYWYKVNFKPFGDFKLVIPK